MCVQVLFDFDCGLTSGCSGRSESISPSIPFKSSLCEYVKKIPNYIMKIFNNNKKYKKVNRPFTLRGGGGLENRWAVHFFLLCVLFCYMPFKYCHSQFYTILGKIMVE